MRIPLISRLEWKLLENDVLTACRCSSGNDHASVHPHKRSYVVCPGLIYGCGEECEESFQRLFARAWNGGSREEDLVFCVGEGNNVIPTIHIKDLTAMLCKLISVKPDPQEHPYILAVDRAGSGQTQMTIVDSIAKKLGVASVRKLKRSEISSAEVKEWVEPLGINVSMNGSDLWEEGSLEWHCEKGFAANIDKIFDEYKAMRGLRCVRILLIGPPAGGKTYFADWLNKKYGIAALKMKEVLEEAKEVKEIKEQLDKIKQQKIEELEAQAKKKKGMEVHPEEVIPKFTPEMIYTVYAKKLSQRIYLNKGYILDGFPKSYKDACNIFLEIPAAKEKEATEEEQTIDYETCKVKEIMPNKVIIFEGMKISM